MDRPFVLHQISDVHIGPMHYAASIKLPLAEQAKEPRNLEHYQAYLRKLNAADLPDLVVISGDLTSFASDFEMSKAEAEIENILTTLKRKRRPWCTEDAPYIFMVPGNHDLDWSKKHYAQKIGRYAQMSKRLYAKGGILSAIYPKGAHPHLPISWDFGDDCNIFVYLFNTTSLGGAIDPRIAKVYKDLAEHYETIVSDKSNVDHVKTTLQELKKLERQDPGYVGEGDISKMEEELQKVSARRFKIAVMHHNPTSVPSDDIEAYDTIINAGALKMSLMNNNFDLILHGHRHFPHCTHERYPGLGDGNAQGFFIICADSLGCSPYAPFVRVDIEYPENAHSADLPAATLIAKEWQYHSQSYQPYGTLAAEPANSAMQATMRRILRNMAREEPISGRQPLLDAINAVVPPIDNLRLRLLDWGEGSSEWIDNFHLQLDDYVQIVATDMAERSSLDSPRFGRYLRQQYNARLASLKKEGQDKCLVFSPSVHQAILRTGWKPAGILWGDYTLRGDLENPHRGLEIVRVLLRDTPATNVERRALQNLDADHRFFAIPLFVANPTGIGHDGCADFAIGLGKRNTILRCFEFEPGVGKVKEVLLDPRRFALYSMFEHVLHHASLQTVPQFLGESSMILDPTRQQDFAESYDNTRKPSSLILEKIREHLKETPKEVGLDIGCGTGNYTLPFVRDYQILYGLDESEQMLVIAKKKAGGQRVHWIQGNALSPTLTDKSFDAIWSISTLHYFWGDQQKLFLQQIFKLLRPNGRMIVDTEFFEQHGSLWLVEFFPSLKKRYDGRIFSQDQYRAWLKEIGFSVVEFDSASLGDEEEDSALRIGQHKPHLYLDDSILRGIPAFHEMNGHERLNGKRNLENAISRGKISEIIEKYEKMASMGGDIGFIIAGR